VGGHVVNVARVEPRPIGLFFVVVIVEERGPPVDIADSEHCVTRQARKVGHVVEDYPVEL
jgi:hypothetical protein